METKNGWTKEPYCMFAKRILLNATGISQLKVQVYDKDLIGSDDLIGATVIDLEDRWFDARWQAWGEEYMIKPGDDAKDPSKVRVCIVRVEC